MAVTIKDVAREAGVSIATVSKVLNGSTRISLATRERVNEVMKRLNFYPNRLARSFVQQSSFTIGLCMEITRTSAFTNPYLYEIMGGIEEVAHENGYLLTVCNIRNMKAIKSSFERMIIEKRADGFILHASAVSRSLIEHLTELRFPFVVIGRPEYPGVCWVDANNELAGRTATAHLLERGFTRPAFIGGPEKDNISESRAQGYRGALLERGLPADERYVRRGEVSREAARRFTEELLSLDPPPDSLLCVSNFAASGAYDAVRARGLSIPRDIAVVGFDNYPLAPYMEPPLTVVDIDLFALGVHAAKALMYAIRNPDTQVQYRMLTPELVPRASTAQSK